MSSLCSYGSGGKYNQFSRDTTQDQYGFIPGLADGPIGGLAREVLNKVGQKIKKAQTRLTREREKRKQGKRGGKARGHQVRKR